MPFPFQATIILIKPEYSCWSGWCSTPIDSQPYLHCCTVISHRAILRTKWAPIASLNLLEFKVLHTEVPTESLTWQMMLMLTKSVTKVEICLEQECWFLCERCVWTEMAKINASRYWGSWGPLKSLEVLSDKYFMQGIEKRLLQNLLKYKDYHSFQQASDQAQCEWASEYVYIVFCRQNTSFSAHDLSQLDVWQPWTGSHVTAFTVQSPD